MSSNKTICLSENKQNDFSVGSNIENFSKIPIEDKLNKFFIFDQDGNLCREGHNIVLNIGRLVSAYRLLGRSITIPANVTPDNVARTITTAYSVYLKGFGVGNGAAAPENTLSPREPLPADIGFSQVPGTAGWLPFTSLNPLPVNSADGKPYAVSAKLKLHMDATNPTLKLDETGFNYVEHTLKINENEIVGNYFNEIVLYFECISGATKFYVPYSKFSFAGLPNIGGKNSYTILYGTYL